MKIELPRQNNYEVALAMAWDALVRRPDEDLEHLGARKRGDAWRIRVLEGEFEVDPTARLVRMAGGEGELSAMWRILALHYLLAKTPVTAATGAIAFEDMASARGYAAPYQGRVIQRFCHTAGREKGKFEAAARSLGAVPAEGGDAAYRLQVFPKVALVIVWYAGDEELPPGASFLYEDNIASILDVEDIVVMAERVVSRLSGKPW